MFQRVLYKAVGKHEQMKFETKCPGLVWSHIIELRKNIFNFIQQCFEEYNGNYVQVKGERNKRTG